MIQGTLKNKKILFICPKFIGYDKALKTEMEYLDAKVLMLNDRPYNAFYNFFKKIDIKIIKIYQIISWYFKLKNIDLTTFDTLFVIRGEHVPAFIYKKIKNAGLKMILYEWDSVKNINYLPQIGYFDKVSTFDREDSLKYGLNYEPLFYRREYTTLESRNPYPKKALFVGTYQAKRYNSVIQLKKKLSDIGITTTIKIRIPYYYYVKQKLKGVKLDKKFLIFEDIGLSEILNLYQSSDIIIDAASEYQTGLTMRTFEALGSNKILLTNNYAIKQEDFFNSNYIKFFDENFSCQNFVNHEYRIHIEEHRIDNWIIKLVGT